MTWLPTGTPMPCGRDWPPEPGWVVLTLSHPGLVADKGESVTLTPELLTNLEMCNRFVNEKIEYEREPNDIWRVADLSGDGDKPRGDCEDFALTKREMLVGQEWPRGSLRLAKCITEDKQVHVVLTVETDRGTFVLDNRRFGPALWDALPYRWISREVPGRKTWALIEAEDKRVA